MAGEIGGCAESVKLGRPPGAARMVTKPVAQSMTKSITTKSVTKSMTKAARLETG